MYSFLISLATMLVAAIIPLLIYAIRKCGAEFTFRGFVYASRKRLYIGGVLMAILSGVVTAFPEVRETFSLAINFVASFLGAGGGSSVSFGTSDVSLGLIVGGLLVAAISGDSVPKASE